MAEPTMKARRSDSVTGTTADSLTAAGCGAFLLWIFGMIDAGHMFVPPAETAMFMGAAILPIAKAIGQRWIREITEDTKSSGGVNGQAPKSNASNPAGLPA